MSDSYSDKSVSALLAKSQKMDFSSILPCNPVVVGGEDLGHKRIVTIVSHRVPESADKRALFFYTFNRINALVCDTLFLHIYLLYAHENVGKHQNRFSFNAVFHHPWV